MRGRTGTDGGKDVREHGGVGGVGLPPTSAMPSCSANACPPTVCALAKALLPRREKGWDEGTRTGQAGWCATGDNDIARSGKSRARTGGAETRDNGPGARKGPALRLGLGGARLQPGVSCHPSPPALRCDSRSLHRWTALPVRDCLRPRHCILNALFDRPRATAPVRVFRGQAWATGLLRQHASHSTPLRRSSAADGTGLVRCMMIPCGRHRERHGWTCGCR